MITVHVNIDCVYPLSIRGAIEDLRDDRIKQISILTGKPNARVIIQADTDAQMEETLIKIQNLPHVQRTDTQQEIGK